MPQPIDLGR